MALKLVSNKDTASHDLIDGKVITPDDQILLNEMNNHYSHIVIGGKHRALMLKNCPIDGYKMSLEAKSEFFNYFSHRPKIAGFNRGAAWWHWGGKNFYPEGVGYYPCVERLPKGTFNTFQPFPCEPVKGDVTLILDHINNVLCDGDTDASEYFIQWLAHTIQKPMNKPTVAVLMKSAEGTGKGTLYKLLKKILNTNAYQVNGAYQLTGRFNSVIAGRLLIFGDEVDLTSKAVFDRVKGIISEPIISMELKGVDPEPIPNYARFIFAGNHNSMIAAGTRERRFLVLEPSTHKIDDRQYWIELNAVIDDHGASSFLHYLLNVDLSSFNPYKAPATKGLIEEKLVSLKPSLAYIFNELCKEKPFDGTVRISSADFIQQFRHWAHANGEPISIQSAGSQMGKTMTNLKINTEGRRGRGAGMYYKLPNADELRDKFAALLGDKKDDLF
jgi:putative DNA primase/helicase